MQRNESTTIALVWIGVVLFVSQGWLIDAKNWVRDKAHGVSAASNGPTKSDGTPTTAGSLRPGTILERAQPPVTHTAPTRQDGFVFH